MRELPRIVSVEQEFPRPKLESVEQAVLEQFESHASQIPDLGGKRIAVAVGSRGISNIAAIVGSVVTALRSSGAQPFIVPAMGSHGGGTPEGQKKILENYGVTPQRTGAQIVASIETTSLGETSDGFPVLVDREAFQSDGIVLINRIKAHTDFKGVVGSGLMKMIAVGLGNVKGASIFHSWVRKLGQERLIESRARALLDTEKVKLKFTPEGLKEIAEFAAIVNEGTENIGARRLHTIMESVLDEISFEAPDRSGTQLSIDEKYVRDKLSDVVKDQDLSRYIL